MIKTNSKLMCRSSYIPMEIQFEYLIILTLVSSILIFLKVGRRRSNIRNLPPGPWKLPLIGNIHNLAGGVPHRRLHELAQKFGATMHLELGELSAVVVSSADVAKQVMKTHDINFASRPPLMVAEILSYGCTSVAFSPYGEYWRQLRKICTLELLSVKRVQSFRPLRERLFLDLVKWVASKEGSAIDLTAELFTAMYAFTAAASFGEKTKEHEELLPIIKRANALGAGFDIEELFPSIKLLQWMNGLRGKLTKLHQQADRILDNIIRQHREARTMKEKRKSEDLLDVLLDFQEEGLQLPLTTDNVKSVIMDMLAAGSETSATTTDWAMVEMLKKPRVLSKAQAEARQVFDEQGFVDESLLHKLPYLKSVVKETLRMHPPAPLLLPRVCDQACQIDGYEIPAETKIIVNAWAINRDPKYWDDPHCFRPERYDDIDRVVDFKGTHFEFIPFGAGRRMCPGMNMGLANIELPLAMFLYHFDWKLAATKPPQEMDMGERLGVTASRVQHLSVIPVIARPLI